MQKPSKSVKSRHFRKNQSFELDLKDTVYTYRAGLAIVAEVANAADPALLGAENV